MAVGRAFLAVPIEGWPETVELLQASGRPWPEWAVVADLRWYVDQVGDLPGRPELQKRWQWTEWNTRQMLAQPDLWWDPTKGEAPRTRSELLQRTSSGPPARLQRASSAPPARLQRTSSPDTEEPSQSSRILQRTSSGPPARLQRASSAPPARLQRTSTRAVSTPPSPSPSPSPTERPAKGGPPAGWEEAGEVYQAEFRPAIGKQRTTLDPKRGLGRCLASLLKRHGVDDTVLLLRHCATSPMWDFQRGQRRDLDTVLRHSDRYLDDARNPGAPARASPARPAARTAAPPAPTRGRMFAALAEIEAEMTRGER